MSLISLTALNPSAPSICVVDQIYWNQKTGIEIDYSEYRVLGYWGLKQRIECLCLIIHEILSTNTDSVNTMTETESSPSDLGSSAEMTPGQISKKLDLYIGMACIALLFPTGYFALNELEFFADLLEYGGMSSDIIRSFIYSVTIFSTLLIVGLSFLGALETRAKRICGGIFLIVMSGISLGSRFHQWADARQEMARVYDFRESWVDFLIAPNHHMAIEYYTLVIIIAILLMRK